MAAAERRNILVVKLGAVGNLALSLAPFAAIRQHHPDARITLLTTKPYAAWMALAPYFDQVWTDQRPEWWNLAGWLRLRRRLVAGRFDRVYDLQTSGRSSRYFQMLPRQGRPEWSGIAPGCSHPDCDPARDSLHDIDRQMGQLRQAGVPHTPKVDLGWCDRGDAGRFLLPKRFALMVPGSSAHRPGKRWPAERYGALARELAASGIASVVLGAAAEMDLAAEIAQSAPVIDLVGCTDFCDIVGLARLAAVAVGNDTGPMHLIAAANCPSLVLFSEESDPVLCAPRGDHVVVLRRARLETLDCSTVCGLALSSARQPAPSNENPIDWAVPPSRAAKA